MNAPAQVDVREARLNAGLTQSEAAHLIHVTARSWTHYEGGTRAMPFAAWELFLLKTSQHPYSKLG